MIVAQVAQTNVKVEQMSSRRAYRNVTNNDVRKHMRTLVNTYAANWAHAYRQVDVHSIHAVSKCDNTAKMMLTSTLRWVQVTEISHKEATDVNKPDAANITRDQQLKTARYTRDRQTFPKCTPMMNGHGKAGCVVSMRKMYGNMSGSKEMGVIQMHVARVE